MKLIKATLVIAMTLLSVMTLPAAANHSVAEALGAFAWEKRQILVFAPDTEHKHYQQFLKVEKEQRAALDERRLQVWHIMPDQPVKLGESEQDTLTAEAFYTEYAVSTDEFRVILVGYDQGEKLRQDSVDIERLFAEIDQMPMRIREMQSQ